MRAALSTTALMLLAVWFVGAGPQANDRVVTGAGHGEVSFGGGVGGGSVPTPPIGQAPPPTLQPTQAGGPVLLSVVVPRRRVVVLRSADGRVLDVRVTDDRGRVALAVPESGALLDILGTDVVGLEVMPLQRLTVVTPP